MHWNDRFFVCLLRHYRIIEIPFSVNISAFFFVLPLVRNSFWWHSALTNARQWKEKDKHKWRKKRYDSCTSCVVIHLSSAVPSHHHVWAFKSIQEVRLKCRCAWKYNNNMILVNSNVKYRQHNASMPRVCVDAASKICAHIKLKRINSVGESALAKQNHNEDRVFGIYMKSAFVHPMNQKHRNSDRMRAFELYKSPSAQSKCKRNTIHSIYCITLDVLCACLHVCCENDG